MDSWYLDHLVCPIDHLPLKYSSERLISPSGRTYPVIDGVPVMLVAEAASTHGILAPSLRRANGDPDVVDQRAPELYLESLGIGEEEKVGLVEFAARADRRIDPAVAYLIAGTSGKTYRHLLGKIDSYPIPELRLPSSTGDMLLDIGCNWGRWSIAAARKGYETVGIDPSLGAIMAARRVAKELGLPIRYVVADARFLPFKASSFDVVFSFGVLQHLAKENVKIVLGHVARLLKPGGTSLIQMANALGVRSLQHQARRRFREARGFEVRYWTLTELRKTFDTLIGPTSASVDCYFGLGLQSADARFMTPALKALIALSEFGRRLSQTIPALTYVADSVYLQSTRA